MNRSDFRHSHASGEYQPFGCFMVNANTHGIMVTITLSQGSFHISM